MHLNETEKAAFKKLSEDIENSYHSAGCNDLELKDTPENRTLVDKANAYANGCTYVEWPDSAEYGEVTVHSGRILTQDQTIFSYLKSLVLDTPV